MSSKVKLKVVCLEVKTVQNSRAELFALIGQSIFEFLSHFVEFGVARVFEVNSAEVFLAGLCQVFNSVDSQNKRAKFGDFLEAFLCDLSAKQ